MAQLQIPLPIWLAASPDERDAFYLGAGFDPNLPVIDNGTDTHFVRFRQDAPATNIPILVSHIPQAGDDLRDFSNGVQPPTAVPAPVPPLTALDFVSPAVGGVVGSTALAARIGGSLRPQYATWLAGVAGIPKVAWAQVPTWLQRAMAAAGIAGAAVVIEGVTTGDVVPFVPDVFGSTAGTDVPSINVNPMDHYGPGPHPPDRSHIIGSWIANGVTFYRLVDGKLAVQNKRGRWKVWKPKKPIVLYADGASNMKTMLRADKALNKQAKAIAAMLNRRSPRPRSKKKDDKPTIIVQGSGRVIDN